jgi:hypothetical protein
LKAFRHGTTTAKLRSVFSTGGVIVPNIPDPIITPAVLPTDFVKEDNYTALIDRLSRPVLFASGTIRHDCRFTRNQEFTMDDVADGLKERLAEINVARRGIQLDKPHRETYAHLCGPRN